MTSSFQAIKENSLDLLKIKHTTTQRYQLGLKLFCPENSNWWIILQLYLRAIKKNCFGNYKTIVQLNSK